MTTLETILAACHLLLLAPLCVLGLHKAWMMLLWSRQRQGKATPSPAAGRPASLPRVTVQLPLFNERYVVERLAAAVAGLDYPRDRLQIQFLDDSTDDTPAILDALLPSLPVDLSVQHVRRTDRVGFKAGALAHGLTTATGEFVAVFDADFTPPEDFLTRTIPHFDDPKIGLVQARWGHVNRNESALTQVQALLLDGHFAIEQPARAGNGCFFNFNGTAGIFRRSCISDAGGWQHDTLTEDMDLSYRAQLRGWEFRYLPDLCCPAELPGEMNGFLTQQHRWAKGSIQTGRKLMGRILAARLPWRTKMESVFHLFGNLAFPILLGLILVSTPLQLVRWLAGVPVSPTLAFVEGMPLLLATLSVITYYGLSQLSLRRLNAAALLRLPAVLILGAGACLNNTMAVLEGLRRDPGEFRRTPKGGVREAEDPTYHAPRGWLPLGELFLAAWTTTSVILAIHLGMWATAGIYGLFAAGLFWVGQSSLRGNRRSRALLLPAAVLAGCSGGGGENPPILADNPQAQIVACQAILGDEFARTEIIHTTRQNLGLDDLPSRSGMEFGVRVHPDGKRLVFARERTKNQERSREIHLASLDGSVFDTRLTANNNLDDSPCWSPDGGSILFSSDRAGSRHLWRMAADGSNQEPFTSGAVDDRDPDWHASGIVFSRTDTTASTPRARLFLTDATGASLTALTQGGSAAGDFEPAWAPDGNGILFVREMAPGWQVLMLLAPGSVLPTPVGDGGGQDRNPRWSPRGDRIFLARSRPAQGIGGSRMFAMGIDGSEPVMLYPDQRYGYPGFDLVPSLPAYPPLESAALPADVPNGVLSMRLGRVSGGHRREVDELDGRVLSIRAEDFDGRKAAGVLLTLDLPIDDPNRIAWLTIDVTAKISRRDEDSFLRLALRDFVKGRYDSALEISPPDDTLRTWSFQTSSLRHVDRNSQIRLEVIGDISDGDPVDLQIDHIGVKVRLRAAQ